MTPYDIGDFKNIGLLGLGKTNLALLERLSGSGATLTLRSKERIDIPEGTFKKVFFGEEWLSRIDEDMILLSPSVRRDIPEIAAAEERGVKISSDTELFFEKFDKPVIAITGSDGKSTVTYLTAQMTYEALGSPPSSNFGLPFCELLDRPSLSGAVAELSSFQLQYIKPRLFRAAITNVRENHLNWHKDFSEYTEAKLNIFENAEERVLFLDSLPPGVAARYPLFAVASLKHSELELRSLSAKYRFSLRDGYVLLNGEQLIDTRELTRHESYNVANIMTAAALSLKIASEERIIECAKRFGGLPHRAELVLSRCGIDFVNSSIDTTPERTATTLSSLQKKSTVILCGVGKGLSYEPLMRALSEYAAAVVITGTCTDALLQALRSAELQVPYYVEKDFHSAVVTAIKITECGGRVLLSPAHTSYDEFPNFEARGEKFRAIVKEYHSAKNSL